jgi:hypothetical protein
MLYQTPNISDFVSLFTYAQTIVPFAQLTVLAIFFTSFFALKKYETLKALPPSIFITFLSALFFYLLGLLEVFWVLGSAVALALCIIILYFSQREF